MWITNELFHELKCSNCLMPRVREKFPRFPYFSLFEFLVFCVCSRCVRWVQRARSGTSWRPGSSSSSLDLLLLPWKQRRWDGDSSFFSCPSPPIWTSTLLTITQESGTVFLNHPSLRSAKRWKLHWLLSWTTCAIAIATPPPMCRAAYHTSPLAEAPPPNSSSPSVEPISRRQKPTISQWVMLLHQRWTHSCLHWLIYFLVTEEMMKPFM